MPNTYTLLGDADETAPLISKDPAKDPTRGTANSPSPPSSTCGSFDLCADPQCCCCVPGRPRGLYGASANPPTIPWPSDVSGSGYEPSVSSIGGSTSSSEWEASTGRSLRRLATYHVDEPTWRKVWHYLECSRAHEAGRDVEGEGDNDTDEPCLAQCVPAWLSSALWPAASMSEAPPNHNHSAEDDAQQPTWHQDMHHPQPTQAAADAASSIAPASSSSPGNGPRYVIKFPSGRRVERYQDATTRRIVVMELGPAHQ